MFNSILDCIDTICLYTFESLEYYYQFLCFVAELNF